MWPDWSAADAPGPARLVGKGQGKLAGERRGEPWAKSRAEALAGEHRNRPRRGGPALSSRRHVRWPPELADVDPVELDHGQTLQPQAERIAGHRIRIVSVSAEHVGLQHSATDDIQPFATGSDRALQSGAHESEVVVRPTDLSGSQNGSDRLLTGPLERREIRAELDADTVYLVEGLQSM